MTPLTICLIICVLTMVILFTLAAAFFTNWVRVKPAATTNMATIITPLLSRTYRCMEDNMDVDLSAIISGEKTYQEMGRELLQVIFDICNGKLTKAPYGYITPVVVKAAHNEQAECKEEDPDQQGRKFFRMNIGFVHGYFSFHLLCAKLFRVGR